MPDSFRVKVTQIQDTLSVQPGPNGNQAQDFSTVTFQPVVASGQGVFAPAPTAFSLQITGSPTGLKGALDPNKTYLMTLTEVTP